jgi:hypothetical protein
MFRHLLNSNCFIKEDGEHDNASENSGNFLGGELVVGDSVFSVVVPNLNREDFLNVHATHVAGSGCGGYRRRIDRTKATP